MARETIVSRTEAKGWRAALAVALLATTTAGGCGWLRGRFSKPARAEAVPEPVDLLLPRKIQFQHTFTGTRVFREEGGKEGFEIRLEALDADGDTTKAFGQFRFELYTFDPTCPQDRGKQLAIWPVDIEDPKANRRHWSRIARCYEFKLGWAHPIPIGQKFILRAVFQSRFTPRLFDEQVFVSE